MTQDKPKGYFEKVLAIDCETTGIGPNRSNPSEGQQAVSWGVIVADAMTLKPIEELYVEIKYNEESRKARERDSNFGVDAAAIHGLSFKYLEEHGITEEEAVVKIANLIIKHWGPDMPIKALGHNVVSFDIPFLDEMFKRHGIVLQFGHRHYDTNSVGFVTTGSFTSDAFFSTMGFDTRGSHNALEDTKQSLECARRVRVLWNSKVGVHAYD